MGSVVGDIAGAVIGGRAARKAAQAMQQGAAETIRTGQQQLDRVTGLTQQARDIGGNAMNQLNTLASQYSTPIDASAVQNEAGYQFGLNQGLGNVQNTAAAKGGLYSGNALKALTQYGNDYATTKYGDAYNRIRQGQSDNWGRYSQLTGYGQQANQDLINAGQNYTSLTGNALMGSAQAQGQSRIAQGQLWGNAASSIGSALGGKGFGASGKAPGLVDSAEIMMQPGGGYADGGAVRKNYMDGGMVDGPGGPRDDAIPAYLSDGEHVMDAASVKAMGGGNEEMGHLKLNLLRMILKA